jgi:tetratricopeptide (TPR) repeat protein
MATKTAPTAWSPTAGAARYRPRQLWQVPVFLAGILALGGVVLTRGVWSDRSDAAECDLAAARRLAADPNCSIERLQHALERPLADARTPAHPGEAHFLLGSAYLLQAGQAGADKVPGLLQQARTHLEQADALGVPDADRPRLDYRLGKVWFHTQGDPACTAEALARSVPAGADDPVEGYALLAQAYLRLPQPDLQAALDANWKQLQLPTLNEAVLAPARLLRGELLLRLQKPDEAREILKFIKPPAPPELVLKARCLQARTYQAEEKWAQAAQLWQEILAEPAVPATDAAVYRYYLGVSRQQLGQRQEAVEAWEKARAQGPGDAALAAALALAALRLQDTSPQAAMDDFRRVVRDVHGPDDWHNALVDLAQVRAVFERACTIYQTTGRHPLAMELAGLYERLAPPGAAQVLYARAAEAAARELRESAARTQPAEAARKLEEPARKLFREAGRKYEASLPSAATPAEQMERLSHSANCLVQGEDCAAAVGVLQRWLKLGPPAEQVGEIWFCLGEAYRALHQEAEAAAAYRECLQQRGPAGYRARYELALMEMSAGQWDAAADALEENLKALRLDPDAEAQEKSLFALGNLLYRRQDYLMASVRLEEALRLFKESPRAVSGRYQLAECYRSLAGQESQNLRLPERMTQETEHHFEEQRRTWLQKAACAYGKVIQSFADRLDAGPLPEEDETLYRLACTGAAECHSGLGDVEAAVRLLEPLAARYHDKVEGLAALAGLAQCYWRKGQNDEARRTLDRIRATLDAMPDSAFPGTPGTGTKLDWEEWLGKVSGKPGGGTVLPEGRTSSGG